MSTELVTNETFDFLNEKEGTLLKGLLSDKNLVDTLCRISELRQLEETLKTEKNPKSFKIKSEGFSDSEKETLEKNTNEHYAGNIKESIHSTLSMLTQSLKKTLTLPEKQNEAEKLYELFLSKQKIKKRGRPKKKESLLSKHTRKKKEDSLDNLILLEFQVWDDGITGGRLTAKKLVHHIRIARRANANPGSIRVKLAKLVKEGLIRKISTGKREPAYCLYRARRSA